jgi:alpha-tubulin suppressor-like RCC1 family protein
METVELNIVGSRQKGKRQLTCALFAGLIALFVLTNAGASGASIPIPVPTNTLSFTESLSDTVICPSPGTNCDVVPADRPGVTVKVSMVGVNSRPFTPTTSFAFSLGELSVTNILSDDPKYSSGKTGATFTRTGLNNKGKTVILQTVHLAWSVQQLNISISGNSSNITILAGLYNGLPSASISTNISGSLVFGDANAVFASIPVTGTVVTKTVKNGGGEALGSTVSLKGSARSAYLSPGEPLIAQQIAAGSFHGLAVATNGAAYAWGYNTSSQLGNSGQVGNGTPTNSALALPVTGLTNVLAMAGGLDYSIGVAGGNTVLSWGANDLGQLGNGLTNDSDLAAAVPGVSNIVSVSSWLYHVLALDNEGNLWGWGDNLSGQLGIGTLLSTNAPVRVPGISNVVVAATGGYHSLAVDDTGAVWAWGYNGYGQLGNGTTNNTSTPAPTPGLTNIVTVAGGLYHSLAVADNGTVWAWGFNTLGQLGNDATNDNTVPVPVSGISNAVAVAAGEYHSLALASDGVVWAWGYNGYGQLGNGTTNNTIVPTRVSGLSNIVAIAANIYDSFALNTNGTVWAWGDNAYGQLGNGTTNYSPVPVQVRIHRP